MSSSPDMTNTQAQSYRWLTVISVLFVTCLITANIIAVKLIAIGPFVVPAGVIIFPVSYIFGDILTEVYGYSVARRVIWTGFLGNLLAVAAIWLAQVLPAASFWEGQRSYETILGYTPRLLAASFLAYLVGEFLNSFVLARMKTVTRGRWLWSRTIGSTLAGEGADSLVFITVAFFGTMAAGPLGAMVVTQWLFKVAYEVAATPLTYGAVAFLKRQEKVDSYDVGTKFNPFLIAE